MVVASSRSSVRSWPQIWTLRSCFADIRSASETSFRPQILVYRTFFGHSLQRRSSVFNRCQESGRSLVVGVAPLPISTSVIEGTDIVEVLNALLITLIESFLVKVVLIPLFTSLYGQHIQEMFLLLVHLKLIVVLLYLIFCHSNTCFQLFYFLNEPHLLEASLFYLFSFLFRIFFRVVHHFVESFFVLLQKLLTFIELLLLHRDVLSEPLILFIFGIYWNLGHEDLPPEADEVPHSLFPFGTFLQVVYGFGLVHEGVQ